MSKQFKISTLVTGDYRGVFARFDRALFEYLLPKTGGIELIEFSGSRKGDRVHLQFTRPIKGTWISDIIEDDISESAAYFVDQGTTLPFGLKYWKHKHQVRAVDQDASSIDDIIEFSFGNGLIDVIMLPFLYLSFLPRRSQYKKYFNGE